MSAPAKFVVCAVLLVTAFLQAVAPAEARPVKSLLEMRRENVVMRERDVSCGAAALADLLEFQLGDPVTEREVAKSLIRRAEYVADPMLVRALQGYSLLDLKRDVDGRGYMGIGYSRMSVEDLVERAPIMGPDRRRWLQALRHLPRRFGQARAGGSCLG